MASKQEPEAGLNIDEATRAMLLLMPRVIGRLKRTPLPERLQSMSLAPRHLSLLAYLLFDGPMLVNQLAARLEVTPSTVSLMVSDLSRQGVVERQADPEDGRRTVVALTQDKVTRTAIERWLANGANTWRRVFEPLTAEQRALFVDTIRAYEQEASSRAAG